MSDPRREIYADHAATTAPAPEVVAAMGSYQGAGFGNASSVHRRGEAAREAIETARAQVAALIRATPEEIVFTATGSEANNLALQGALGAVGSTITPVKARRRIVISAIEHPSVLETARALEDAGHGVTVVPPGAGGVIDPERVAHGLGPDVALVSVMLVNNEIGTVQPVAEIARLAKASQKTSTTRGADVDAGPNGVGNPGRIGLQPAAALSQQIAAEAELSSTG